MKLLDSEKEQRGREVAELQARVSLDEQREGDTRRESFGLKQRIMETEAVRDSARKEVGRGEMNYSYLHLVCCLLVVQYLNRYSGAHSPGTEDDTLSESPQGLS